METTREKLQAVRDALADFQRVRERYKKAKSRAEGTRAGRYGGIAGDGNSVHHVGHNALENYMQAGEELGETLNYWLGLLKEQQQQAAKLPNGAEKLIINYRYLWPSLLTWPQIAEKMDLSMEYCYELHKKALALMEKSS